MNNELATNQGHALQQLGAQQAPASVIQIAEWAAELDAAHKLGVALATSKFLPDSITKDNKAQKSQEQIAADAAVIILAGKSLGLDPLTSVQNLFSVRGRPAMYARTAVGLVISHGHEVKRTHASADSVTVTARRRGDREWQTFTWDMSRAQQAGYTSNQLYKSDPVAMLTAKAQMEACRAMFADILMGVPYSAEDLQLEDLGEVDDAPKTTVKRKPRAKSKPQSKPAPEQTDEEPVQEEQSADPEETAESDGDEDTSEPISQQTWDEIKALLKEKAPGDSPGPWAMKTIGRTVKKWAEFTQAEGDQMLELLISGELGAQEEAA